MIALAIKDVEKYYGANLILKRIDMALNEGEKTALIGRNGCGKTTLLRLAAGIEKADKGAVMLRKNMRTGYLEQVMTHYEGLTVYEVLLQGRPDIADLKQQLAALEKEMTAGTEEAALCRLAQSYERLRERFEAAGGYRLELQADWIAGGLQITRDMYPLDFESLSGGEKMRVLFARLLLQEPELLLLDEPTNHLDIKAIEWLEDFIRSYRGTVLVVSHDRYFLDRVAGRVIEIEDGECQAYEGNYSFFIQEKERRLLEEFANYRDQQKEIRRLEEAVKRLRDWGNRGDNEKFFRKAASIEKAIGRMEKIKRPVMDRKKVDLDFEAWGRSGKDVVSCEGLSKSYGNRVLFDDTALYIRCGERIGLIGANGSGKTTLLRLVLGQEAPDRGVIRVGPGVRVGYLAQAVYFEDENRTVLEAFCRQLCLSEGEARGSLARFLFYRDAVFKRLKDLSGGERTRLRLAALMREDVNLLILDEPTNHLDIDTREVLEDALEAFDGTLLFISHDRYFINKLADRLYHIEGGKLAGYCGNYDYFKEQCSKASGNEAANKENTAARAVKKREPDRPQRKAEAGSRLLEEKIHDMEGELALLRQEMLSGENASDYERLQRLHEELIHKEKELEAAYTQWYEACGDLEK